MDKTSSASTENAFDVIVIGAGISGINTAYRLKTKLPGASYAILEARDSIGGTWDLFRYPGVRSDSDLHTFGFAWHPWDQPNPIADGGAIARYMRKAASVHQLDKHILYRHRVSTASWSTEDQSWNLSTDCRGETIHYCARYLVFGTGYYDYHEALSADIPGLQAFRGQVVHPQFWPEDLDYSNKRIVVIGSGATAVTLIPNLVDKASHVTMLQRSPSYVLPISNRSTEDSSWAKRLLPTSVYLKLNRVKRLITSRLFYLFCRTFPARTRAMMEKRMARQLPEDIPVDPHFKPRYNPWDQRVCVCPNGDFFKALRSGKASVETAVVKKVVDDGILLESDKMLQADIIVTATGLKLQMGGGVRIDVDGHMVNLSEKLIWNGAMVQDVPNAFLVIGYTNASWTLGADVTAHLICRLIKYLESRRSSSSAAVPRLSLSESTKIHRTQLLALTSTYVTRGENAVPQAAHEAPWRAHDNYFSDTIFAKYGRLDRGLEFLAPQLKKAKMP